MSCCAYTAMAQPTLKTPLICHNKQDELQYYDDGSFKMHFEQGRFARFISQDSSISFNANGRWLAIRNSNHLNDPVQVRLSGMSVIFTTATDSIQIDSTRSTGFTMNGISFSLYKQPVNYRVQFELNGKTIYLDIDDIGYPTKKWGWDMIKIFQDSSSFLFGYNPFYDGGPSMISRQDESLRYGISIAHSFKTNKYLWRVYPVFYEHTEKSNTAYILNDFEYVYNRRGKLRPKKSSGTIRYCE